MFFVTVETGKVREQEYLRYLLEQCTAVLPADPQITNPLLIHLLVSSG
jgi:hypothetical protein